MVLQNKNAIIYGAGGSIGGAVAKAFASAGARVFLTGRNLSSVEKVADEILASGGSVEVSQVDALNEKEINSHMNTVVQKVATVDISFCAIDLQVVQNPDLIIKWLAFLNQDDICKDFIIPERFTTLYKKTI